ncbi:MAG: LpxL/LpxP family Kdo(2)-lipid IV(A) lauroyl/palmitoleoyl acyltransferase, partial [Gammaproteobacteria bacterium]|nr:LpxL/LpxP family Kdo(2)-lipid IV(A) lauroyl/palmitoleoyl acyltransferase [Gammaproteobacteria bacterium]
MHGFSSTLLHPKYWPAWLGFGLLRLVILLPFPLLYRGGRVLGRLGRRLVTGRARIAERNLQLCFPDLSPVEREQLLKRHFESLGVSLLEIPFTWWGADRRFESLAEISGLENLDAASRAGKGVILLSAHFTCLEIGGRLLSRRAEFDAMYRPSSSPVVEYVMVGARRKGCGELIPRRAAKRALRRLRGGHTVWYAPDQNTQRKQSVFVEFFGHLASTTPATHKLARLTGAKVVPFVASRKADGSGYRLVIEPPLEDFPTNDIVADTQRVNDIIERWVREYPEQYLWIHRRFRSRP